MRNILEEVQIEIIKNSLFKLYLEDFYRVCQVSNSRRGISTPMISPDVLLVVYDVIV